MIRRFYRSMKRRRFAGLFKSFGASSGIGAIGYGDDCIVSGCSYISIGENTWIRRESEIVALDRHFEQKLSPSLSIGSNVHANQNLRITCAGNIVIEDDVLIAPEVFITDHNHGVNPMKEEGYSYQPLVVKDVRIEKGAWLGQRVVVLPGVVIGAHSVIGANSVVTKSIPPYCIAVGSPARVVKCWDFETEQWIASKTEEAIQVN